MTTAIISALPKEQTGIVDQLTHVKHFRYANRTFTTGFLHAKPVVLTLSGVGKVAAATCTTVLIHRFDVEQVLFTGVAGGIAPKVQVGDVVVGTQYVQHDMDASPLFPRHEVPLYGRSHFDADAGMVARLSAAVQRVQGSQNTPFTLHHGLIASGDQFVSSVQAGQLIRDQLPLALCVEMEGAAVAQVCHDHQIPFVAVRTISDRADNNAHTDFPAFMDTVAGPIATQMLLAYFA